MGGLMTLRLLINHPGLFKNAWISSPLLDPMHQAKPWMRAILPCLAPLLPRVTVSTGVTSEDCRDDSVQSEPSSTQLYHSRISLVWGRTLSLTAKEVNEKFTQLPSATKLLFTQGKDDRICPPQFLRDRLLNVTHPAITYEEIPGARHEPLVDTTGNEVAKKITLWLAQTASTV
jgi:alpha-beta hydrolase superfamily lysophospholipase